MIRVGTAGWKYTDWNGIVYPKPKPRGFNELAYLAGYLDAAEINSSYYGPPKPTTTKKWVESVAANSVFQFTAKLNHLFTHERKATVNDEAEFKAGMEPLMEANRLGALLAQFPWSFKNTAEGREYVRRLRARFADYPMVLEVRHASWNEVGILDWLEQIDLGLCKHRPAAVQTIHQTERRSDRIDWVYPVTWQKLSKLVPGGSERAGTLRLPLSGGRVGAVGGPGENDSGPDEEHVCHEQQPLHREIRGECASDQVHPEEQTSPGSAAAPTALPGAGRVRDDGSLE